MTGVLTAGCGALSRRSDMRQFGPALSLVLVVCGNLAAPTASRAESVTFYFGGTVGPYDRQVAGSLTYETATPSSDARRPFDTGERLLYAGAVTDISFASPIASRVYSGGDALTYNDYQYCGSYNAVQCLRHQPEDDRVDFRWQPSAGDSFQLVLTGDAQSFLASGALPNSVVGLPALRASLYWFGLTSNYELAGNVSIAAVPFPQPSPIPEPLAALLMLAGLAVVAVSVNARG